MNTDRCSECNEAQSHTHSVAGSLILLCRCGEPATAQVYDQDAERTLNVCQTHKAEANHR